MRRIAAIVILAVLAIPAGAASASAAVTHRPPDDGSGVIVEVSLPGIGFVEGFEAGTGVEGDLGTPGLCAYGLIHTSCTPAGSQGGTS